MKSFHWYAVIAAGAMLLSLDASAQVGRGRGRGGSPPSNPGQSSGPKSPPPPSKGDQNPPTRGNQGPPPPSKGDQNPPTRGNQGPPPPTKGDQNPPVRGNQGPPPSSDQNPPVRGNQGPPPPTKGDQNPPVRGNQGPPQGSDQNPPVRGNQGPPPPTKGDQNPPVRGNQGPPPSSDKNPPVRGNQGPPTKGDQGGHPNPITRGNQGPPSNNGGGNGNGGIRGGDIGSGPVRGNGGTRGGNQSADVRGNDTKGLPDKIIKVRDQRNTKGQYNGSINNSHSGNNGPTKQPPQTIRSIPNGISLPSQVIREDDPRRRSNIYRTGYYHYDPFWCDDYFFCGNYIFDPWRSRCVVSPWYFYASLPGYLSYNCIRIINIPIYVWSGQRYNYYYNNGWGNGYNNRSDLDYAIDDIRDAFENLDRRALGRVVPRDGRVDIYLGNRYDYSLDANEFNNLMVDGIFNSDTRRYEVVSVETYRNEAEIVARHEFNDPWGRRTTVYHWYRLEQTRRGYVITRFGTSDDNCWR